jgi:hypothetical protein
VVIGGPVDVEGGVRRVFPVVQREELRLAERALDRNAARPDAGGEERGRDVGTFSRPLAPVEAGDDRGIEGDRRRVVAAARDRQRRRRARVARQPE